MWGVVAIPQHEHKQIVNIDGGVTTSTPTQAGDC